MHSDTAATSRIVGAGAAGSTSQFSTLQSTRKPVGDGPVSLASGPVCRLIECRRGGAVNVYYYGGRVETRLECRTSIMFTADRIDQ